MSDRPILIISGTNRPGANALRIATIIQGHYQRENAATELLSLTEMTPEIFEPSAYASKPPKMVELQNRVLSAAGLHIVTPEYNGSFPGVLKYFIDMLKFPESFEAKPVAFVGEAAGIWGGLRAVEQLQHIFGYRNAHIFPDRVFIPGINQKLDSAGNLIGTTRSEIDERLARQVAGFKLFVQRLTTH
jgi:NAD(P)H-dependent FMN reductase